MNDRATAHIDPVAAVRLGRGIACRPGFTMMEMAVSVAIFSLVIGAVGSAIVIASRALPNGQSPTDALLQAGDGLNTMCAELGYATAVTEHGSTAVTITVADRTADGSADTIRYAWAGTAGNPLTRRVNGGSAVTVVANVQSLQLAYDSRPKPGQPTQLLLTAIRVQLRSALAGVPALQTAARIVNEPEVSLP